MEKELIISGKAKGSLCMALFIIFFVAVLSGCEKEKQAGSKIIGAPGTCEVSDKLPGGIAKPVEVDYGGKIKLWGLTAEKISKGQLRMDYFWQLVDDPGLYNTVFVHFASANYEVLFQNDHLVCGKYPLNRIKGKFLKETHLIDIPESAIGKEANVGMGIYAPGLQSGPRLKIESSGQITLKENNTSAIVDKLNL